MKVTDLPALNSTGGNTVIASMKALAKGEADSGQQTAALNYIINVLASTYGPEYDSAWSQSDKDFLTGRRFVGREIRRLIVQSHAQLTGKPAVPTEKA